MIRTNTLYLAQSYREYFSCTCQNLYHSRKVTLPEPELYVIYTGERGSRPDEISLSRDFFGGKETAIDVKVKVIYERENGGDIHYDEFI